LVWNSPYVGCCFGVKKGYRKHGKREKRDRNK
jgi:hypothetical protein